MSSEKITTPEQLDAIPEGRSVLDSFGDIATKTGGVWVQPETVNMTSARMVRYGPFTLMPRGDAR